MKRENKNLIQKLTDLPIFSLVDQKLLEKTLSIFLCEICEKGISQNSCMT